MHRHHTAAALVCAALCSGALLGLRCSGATQNREAPAARRHGRFELKPEYADLAVACIVGAHAHPSLAALSEVEFDSTLTTLGAWLQANLAGDFRAFAHSRQQDLEHADRTRAEDAANLLHLVRSELGRVDEPDAGSWSATLERFWMRVYDTPPLRAVDPTTSHLELDSVAWCALSVESWLDTWEHRKRELLSGADAANALHIDHRPAAPHRRTLEDLAHRAGELRWLDWRVNVQLRGDCLPATVLLRLVWDADDRAWFLHDALTVYAAGCDPEPSRSFLLF